MTALGVTALVLLKKDTTKGKNLMNKKILVIKFALICIILWLVIGNLESAFKDLTWSVRSAGIAGAFTAVSDDVSASMFNPAGLDQILEKQVQFMYSSPYTGLKLYSGEEDTVTLGQSCLSGAVPFKFGSFGFTWANYSVSSLYSENIFALTYAKRINDISEKFSELPIPIYFGLNIKQLSQEYILDEKTRQLESQSQTSPFSKGTKTDAVAIDLGTLVYVWDFKLGLSLKNLNQPEIGLVQKETVPLEIRLGTSYQTDYKIFNKIVPSLELYYRKPQNLKEDLRVMFGVEGSIADKYNIRTGFNDREFALGGGLNLSVGNRHAYSILFDYAFVWSFVITDNLGSHKISVGLKF